MPILMLPSSFFDDGGNHKNFIVNTTYIGGTIGLCCRISLGFVQPEKKAVQGSCLPNSMQIFGD